MPESTKLSFSILTAKKVYCPYDNERYGLKAYQVDIGDMVYVASNHVWWIVVDTDNLGNDDGYDMISFDPNYVSAGPIVGSGLTMNGPRVVGKTTAGMGGVQELTGSDVLDMVGTTRGSLLYRGTAGWAVLAPGTAGFAITSGGPGADPVYAASTSTIAGTAGNVLVNGVTTAQSGAVTLSLPSALTGINSISAVPAATNFAINAGTTNGSITANLSGSGVFNIVNSADPALAFFIGATIAGSIDASSTTQLNIASRQASSGIDIYTGGVNPINRIARFTTSGLSVTPGNVAAVTLGGTSGAGTITGGDGTLTIRPSGNSRTIVLQSTSSGGVAQTNLTLNADLTATFASNVTGGANFFAPNNGGFIVRASGGGNGALLSQTTGDNLQLANLVSGKSVQIQQAGAGTIQFLTNSTVALTLGPTQGATFAGFVKIPNNVAYSTLDSAGTTISTLSMLSDNTVLVGAQSAAASNGHLLFYANGSEAGRITPSLQFLLGSTANHSSERLQVTGNFYASGTGQFTGNVGIGTGPQTKNGLFITGTQTGNNSILLYSDGILAASADNDTLAGIRIAPTVATGTFVGLDYKNFSIGVTSKTGTGTIANAYQLYIEQGVAATNSYGIYQAGTNPNFLTGVLTVCGATATPANGSTSARLLFGTTSGFGIYYGSGSPTVSAAQGSLYLRSDGTTSTTRAYINNSSGSGTTWTPVTTLG